jgi:hypothetical protein
VSAAKNAQDLTSLKGKVLRISVPSGPGAPDDDNNYDNPEGNVVVDDVTTEIW